jgi:hypothetical protein
MSQGPIAVQLRPYARSPANVGIRYDTYTNTTATAVIVKYGTSPVIATDTAAAIQIATAGVRNRFETCRNQDDRGNPPSRANANTIREVLVNAASPHRY